MINISVPTDELDKETLMPVEHVEQRGKADAIIVDVDLALTQETQTEKKPTVCL